MRRWIVPSIPILVAALALAAASAGPPEDSKPSIQWLTDFGATLDRAQKDHRLVMIEFYTSWCLYCGKLEKETFGDPRVVALASRFVCAKLDADVQKAAAARYEPEGYPTVVFATASGEEILKVGGFRAADPFLTVMKAASEQGPKIAEQLVRLSENPADFGAREALGTIYLDLGLAEKAEEHLTAAMKAAPRAGEQGGGESDEARIEFLLGRAAAVAKENGKAAKIFQRLIDAYPTSPRLPQYYLGLGRAYASGGKSRKATEVIATLERLFPDAPEAKEASALVK